MTGWGAAGMGALGSTGRGRRLNHLTGNQLDGSAGCSGAILLVAEARMPVPSLIVGRVERGRHTTKTNSRSFPSRPRPRLPLLISSHDTGAAYRALYSSSQPTTSPPPRTRERSSPIRTTIAAANSDDGKERRGGARSLGCCSRHGFDSRERYRGISVGRRRLEYQEAIRGARSQLT